jgi:hypothetical protein
MPYVGQQKSLLKLLIVVVNACHRSSEDLLVLSIAGLYPGGMLMP